MAFSTICLLNKIRNLHTRHDGFTYALRIAYEELPCSTCLMSSSSLLPTLPSARFILAVGVVVAFFFIVKWDSERIVKETL